MGSWDLANLGTRFCPWTLFEVTTEPSNYQTPLGVCYGAILSPNPCWPRRGHICIAQFPIFLPDFCAQLWCAVGIFRGGNISLWEISYFKCVRNFLLNFQATVRNKPGAKFSH